MSLLQYVDEMPQLRGDRGFSFLYAVSEIHGERFVEPLLIQIRRNFANTV